MDEKEKLPPLQTGANVWYGPDIDQCQDDWIYTFTPSDIKELESAAQLFIDSGIGVGAMTSELFPLPSLASRLLDLRKELIYGRGFELWRGLPVDRYSEIEWSTIFYGLGTHVGHARSQNAAGHVLGHVCNLGYDSTDPKVRLYQTSERQTFHTDSCDVVGLLCLQPAREGGRSLLVSADTVFNEMYHRRSDLLRLLMQPIATDRRGEVPKGQLPYLLIPVFSYYQDRITIFYQRQYIESAQRFSDAPRLTDQHMEALDLFDKLCNSSALNCSMMLQKGDIQFVYNHAMLHDRTAFQDWENLDQRRHLARLWLSVPGDRQLPPVFATRYGSVEVGNRGGIVVPGTEFCIPSIMDLRDVQ